MLSTIPSSYHIIHTWYHCRGCFIVLPSTYHYPSRYSLLSHWHTFPLIWPTHLLHQCRSNFAWGVWKGIRATFPILFPNSCSMTVTRLYLVRNCERLWIRCHMKIDSPNYMSQDYFSCLSRPTFLPKLVPLGPHKWSPSKRTCMYNVCCFLKITFLPHGTEVISIAFCPMLWQNSGADRHTDTQTKC